MFDRLYWLTFFLVMPPGRISVMCFYDMKSSSVTQFSVCWNETAISLLQSPRSLRCLTSLSNRWLWTRARSWVSGVTSAGLLLWRSSGWRTGRTWRRPAAPGSASLMGRPVWRSVRPPDTTPAITFARPPTTPAASSARPKSPSKVKTYT